MLATENLLLAFGLTLFAGLSTGIGSAIALMAKRTNTKFLSVALGFSAGVMIYVSFVEILSKSRYHLVEELGMQAGSWVVAGGFFGGIHEIRRVEEMDAEAKKNHRLRRAGVFTAIAIAIHNFPEGLATFTAALTDPALGIAIAVAIAIHNIPEGIAVSVPIFYATGSRKKAFWLSFSSGLAEPLGALIGFFLLMSFMGPVMFGVLFAAVAGIMVFISLDELLPAASEFGEHHLAIYGLVAGMAVMALSLLIMM